MDKTGRFQKFTKDGKFTELAAKIDDYIGNGFTVRKDEAVIACSGIVLDKVIKKGVLINLKKY
jgi:hypothetical protein